MAIKFIAVTFFFQLVVMLPIHHADTGGWGLPNPVAPRNHTSNSTSSLAASPMRRFLLSEDAASDDGEVPSERMLWLYVFFVYLFSGFALYLIVVETKKIIRVRQDYLGSQSTVTDRTVRLSGIPEELRSEEMIKETVENLQIGKVDSVLLCRDWTEVDDLTTKRMNTLRKLEEAWTVHLGASRSAGTRQVVQDSADTNADAEDEGSRLLGGNSAGPDHTDKSRRPKTRIWFGFLGLQSRKIDAIDFYEEKLRKLDEEIKSSRRKVFKPTPLAFVTLDSTAAAVGPRVLAIITEANVCSKWLCKP